LKFSLWDDRIITNQSIGTSPFQIVYGTEDVFPTQLGLLVMKFMKE